ncbi:MbcA/ParS/Xre antitoxin family protein [Dyella ginsengisoli]|uniref:MbcA/ParS/Xre antitoxin family protein n=1 Tax=Dyella ginsengisoli TaxID=363848 RepID=UPI00034AE54A|nr:MbcA/ParS/Xre antitoxin family protein [Dyella ginsengisoli]
MVSSPQAATLHLADLGGPALRSFFRLAEVWKLRVVEQRKLLGDPPESTFYKWKREQDGSPGRDVIERISYLLGIFKALQILFPDPAQADAWLRKPNQAALFGGQSALERMLSGNVADLFVVRQYLDAQRG